MMKKNETLNWYFLIKERKEERMSEWMFWIIKEILKDKAKRLFLEINRDCISLK